MRFSLALVSVLTLVGGPALAGPLDPPAGPISGTPGPEPRTPISIAATPGDSNSLFKITQPGSYYLTGNITGVAARHGIEIAATNVTLDLNGFALVGVPGSLDGITTDVANPSNVIVRNGAVSAWGAIGVNLGNTDMSLIAEELVVLGCGSEGISVGENAVVRACSAARNAGAGILANANASITGCAVRENTGVGILTGLGNTVAHCSARGNGGAGISVGAVSTLVACAAYDNAGPGFSTASNCTVDRCAAGSNDGAGIACSSACVVAECAVASNGSHGIEFTSGCVVRANLCHNNGLGPNNGAGLSATGADNRIEANSCTLNDRGVDVTSAGNIIIRNTCSGNGNNWNIIAGNRCLVVSSPPGAVGISGDSGGSALGSTDPNANFTY